MRVLAAAIIGVALAAPGAASAADYSTDPFSVETHSQLFGQAPTFISPRSR